MDIKKFKPQLFPNDKAGTTIDWEKRIKNPQEWMVSDKLDGVRAELLPTGKVLGRSLKPIRSNFVQTLGESFVNKYKFNGLIEGELYSPSLSFGEIIHFVNTQDVTLEAYLKEKEKEYENFLKGKGMWDFPGRTPEFLTTIPEDLYLHVFDCYISSDPKMIAFERYEKIKNIEHELVKIIPKYKFYSVDDILNRYQKVIIENKEGLILLHSYSIYKTGRYTLKESMAFKMKDSNNWFDGVILEVVEGTYVDPAAEKTINELGRSVTSKKLEDRIPGGYAKGFLVEMSKGRTLTVSLSGYSQQEKEILWQNKKSFVGISIRFIGMNPVKEGGVPRHAHYVRGNIRDSKN